MSKKNIQLFRTDDEFSAGMFDVADSVSKVKQSNLWKLKDTFAISRYFGEFLWDNQLFDLAKFFSRDYWASNYEAIIKAMAVAGTYEAYLTVVNSAMGDGRITFDNPSPSHLIITVSAGDIIMPAEALLEDGSKDFLNVYGPNYPGEALEFVDSTSQLTFQETVKLIELLNVNGVFVEIVAS